jgi:hypothetical protein
VKVFWLPPDPAVSQAAKCRAPFLAAFEMHIAQIKYSQFNSEFTQNMPGNAGNLFHGTWDDSHAIKVDTE